MKKIPKHLYPFDRHWLDLEGIRLHYLDEGDGEPVVAVHGNPTWSFYYRELVKGLRDDHRVVVPDHIARGYRRLADAGVPFEKEPAHSPEYGIYHCFFRDPNGYLLEIQQFDDPGWAEPISS